MKLSPLKSDNHRLRFCSFSGILLFLSTVFIITGCQKKGDNVKKIKPYKGPVMELTNSEMLYSDSGRLEIRTMAPRQLEYENGNTIYPESIYIEFYNEEGKISSTIKADYAKRIKKKNLYTVRENVVVRNIQEQKKLTTPELHWKPEADCVYTDDSVRIQTKSEILKGKGLVSDEKFSDYRILNPSGIFTLEGE